MILKVFSNINVSVILWFYETLRTHAGFLFRQLLYDYSTPQEEDFWACWSWQLVPIPAFSMGCLVHIPWLFSDPARSPQQWGLFGQLEGGIHSDPCLSARRQMSIWCHNHSSSQCCLRWLGLKEKGRKNRGWTEDWSEFCFHTSHACKEQVWGFHGRTQLQSYSPGGALLPRGIRRAKLLTDSSANAPHCVGGAIQGLDGIGSSFRYGVLQREGQRMSQSVAILNVEISPAWIVLRKISKLVYSLFSLPQKKKKKKKNTVTPNQSIS